MPRLSAIVLLLCPLYGQDPSPATAELVEKLRSERPEERERAARHLVERGAAARAELERATGDSDPEVAGRARRILQGIDLRARLTPALLRALPGVADRLDGSEEHDWTEAFLEATARKGVHPKHPELRRQDLEPLVKAGQRDGVRPLLDSRRGLFHLHAIRDPELYKRLVSTRLDEPFYGTTGQIMGHVARKLGMELVPPQPGGPFQSRWDNVHRRAGSRLEPPSLADLLEHFHWSAVFEGGRLHAVAPEQAHARWAAWWEKESGQK